MGIRKNGWVKFVVLAATAVVGVCTLLCLVGTLVLGFEFSYQRSQKDYEEQFLESALEVYGADFFSNENLIEKLKGSTDEAGLREEYEMLDGGNIRYTLVREEEDGKEVILYTNDRSVNQGDCQAVFRHSFHNHYVYNLASPVNLLRGCSAYWTDSDTSEWPQYILYLKVTDEPESNLTLTNGREDYLAEVKQMAEFCYIFSKNSGWWFGAGILLFLVGFSYLMRAAGYHKGSDEPQLCVLDKLPLGLFFMAWGSVEYLLILLFVYIMDCLPYTMIAVWMILSAAGAVAWIGVVLGIIFCMSIAVRIKTKNLSRYTICYYIFSPMEWVGRLAREKMPLFVKLLLWYLLITIGEFICLLCYSDYQREELICFLILFKLVEFPLLCHLLYQLKIIQEGGERIAAGDYSRPIDTDYMTGDFKKHALNLNRVSEGIATAVEARMKSERFRTELITNVSHDIKTPLTSIINYVDLIKKEKIDHPVVTEYVEVLDRQSARLKKLIEDLMEASKASTGNLPVNPEIVDAKVMLSQVVGEFEERAAASELELVVESPKEGVEILVDGRHLWRILDNLMCNICKYAMPKTRVYINLESYHGMAIMTFRNISRAKLNIPSEELMERFVRGDSSRNTEGSGLGLNIAQNLTHLMNGNMAIQIDGDLFKVIVSFAICH